MEYALTQEKTRFAARISAWSREAKLLHVLFKKEFSLQSRSGLTLINRLLVGPMIGLLTTGILYNSFFSVHPDSSLGDISGSNYLPFVAFGFLMHTFLNAGYYCFSSRIISEAGTRTLALLRIAPYSRVVSLFSLASMDAVKAFVVLIIAMFVAGMPPGSLVRAVGREMICFVVFFPLCLSIGLLRTMITYLHADVAEFLDHLYMIFVLSACPYIPKSLLPKYIAWFCEFNPAYHMAYVMRKAWKPDLSHAGHLIPTMLLMSLLIVAGYVTWRRVRVKLLEKCFA